MRNKRKGYQTIIQASPNLSDRRGEQAAWVHCLSFIIFHLAVLPRIEDEFIAAKVQCSKFNVQSVDWYPLRLLRIGASAQYFLVYEWNASVGGDNIGVVLWKLDF